jgi:predicted nucleic acid-binding Zn ribbon protein
VTEVVGEREGVVTVECSSAVWAQELELMAPRIVGRLKNEIGDSAPEKLRFRAADGP